MFNLFKRTKIEAGRRYAAKRKNPFSPLWIAKVIEVRDKFVKYETWQQGCLNLPINPMPVVERSDSENNFRFFYSEVYLGED